MENKIKSYKIYGWLLIIITLFSGIAIKWFTEFSTLFLILLIVELGIALSFNRKIFDRNAINLSRILLGLLFIYSGFVKAVDPIGTNYKIIDYFIAYGTEWASPLAIYLSIFLNAFEFVVGGILLFLNVKTRLLAWLVLAMMIFFTIVTAFDALYNPVPDCGCFGEAIILSNWQTFYKNLVIDVFLVILFFNRKRIKKVFTSRGEWAIIGIAVFMVCYFQIHNYRHLPLVDFRAWKVGNKMVNENPQPLQYFVTYMNKESGEKQEFLSPNFPYNDSIWLSQWHFVDQRIDDPNPKQHDLIIFDNENNDVSAQFIENPDFQFLLISHDLTKAKKRVIQKIFDFYTECYDAGISFVILTSSSHEECQEFDNKSGSPGYEYYFADDTALEAIVRANPGLVLLRNAVVLGKWHHNDFPKYEYFVEDYYQKEYQ